MIMPTPAVRLYFDKHGALKYLAQNFNQVCKGYYEDLASDIELELLEVWKLADYGNVLLNIEVVNNTKIMNVVAIQGKNVLGYNTIKTMSLLAEASGAEKVVVKADNKKSYKMLTLLGFTDSGTTDENNKPILQYIIKNMVKIKDTDYNNLEALIL